MRFFKFPAGITCLYLKNSMACVNILNYRNIVRNSSSFTSCNVLQACKRSYSGLSSNVQALRPYQKECADAILNSLARSKRPAVSLPTGSGKTRVFSYVLQHVKCMHKEDESFRSKVLVVVNRRELLDQAVNSIRNVCPEINVGYMHGKTKANATDEVVVATYQTLTSGERINDLNPDTFKLIIIDEAHHSAAYSYTRVLEHFNAVGPLIPRSTYAPENPTPGLEDFIFDFDNQLTDISMKREDNPERRVHVVGFSATFWRADNKLLGDVYDEVCYHETMESMVEKGFLCPGKLTSISVESTGCDLKKFQDSYGRLQSSDFFTSREGVDLIFDAWAENSYRKHTVIFGASLSHLTDINAKFSKMGVDSRIIHSKLSGQERQALIHSFSIGEFPVLLNCQILTEGTDIPRIDQVIIARGVKSKGLFMQMVGRGLRIHPSKKDCNIVIFKEFHVFDGAFIPQLFHNNECSSPRTHNDSKSKSKEVRGRLSDQIDYSQLLFNEEGEFSFDKMSLETYGPLTPEQSVFCWINSKSRYYIFPMKANYYYKISREGKMWSLKRTTTISKKFKNVTEIVKTPSLDETLKHADLLLKNSKYRSHLLRTSPWRFGDATDAQKKIIASVMTFMGPKFQIRRGLACDLISLKLIGVKLTQELVESLDRAYQPKNSA